MAKTTGGTEQFSAELNINYFKGATYAEEYNKTVVVDEQVSRSVVNVSLTAPSLEKLQEKLTAYVGLAEL